jgi:uncharacterized protein YndB with AHSA1/START domain
MTDRSVTHATFVVERTFDVPPARVFQAFADPEVKARWFAAPDDWGSAEVSMDFRVGGREINNGGPKGGPIHYFESEYHDIVPDERIVYSYWMHMDEKLISVSVATIEFRPQGTGTHLVLTEQGAFLDGLDQAQGREEGTRQLMGALAAELEREPAGATQRSR